jgi:hypothetical protein
MKKMLVLLLVFFVVVCDAAAQTRGLLSLSLGPAIPVGAFGSKDGTTASSGLADVGALADLSYQRAFGASRFGWMATLRGRFNGVSKSASIAPLAAEFPGYGWSINNGRWTAASALIGGYYQLPLTAKLCVSANLQAGVAEAWSPKQSILGVRDSVGYGAVDFVQGNLQSAHVTAFTALAGLGLCYKLCGRWSIQGRVDYTYLKPEFTVTATVVNAQHLITPNILSLFNAETVYYNALTQRYKQAMPCIDVMVGVVREL